MTFTGKGVVWNPKKGRPLVNFKNVKSFQTDDKGEIALLNAAVYVEAVEDAKPINEPPEPDNKEPTRAELIKEAKDRGIKGAAQMRKADLIEKLES